jgi:hypothetical protein
MSRKQNAVLRLEGMMFPNMPVNARRVVFLSATELTLSDCGSATSNAMFELGHDGADEYTRP